MASKNKHKNWFLTFRLGRENFALPIHKVLEVLQKQYITELPEMPNFIKGVINFRGDILPVFDVRIKFNMHSETLENFVIVVLEITDNAKTSRLCALVDQVRDVIAIDAQELLAVPEMGLKYKAEYLKGMVKSGESFVTILDIDKIFDSHLDEIANIVI